MSAKDSGPPLLQLHEIPDWQRENEYLLSGYRPTSGSLRVSFASIAAWHNETINIQSHIIGAVLFLCLPWHFHHHYYQHTPDARMMDLVLFGAYAAGVAACFVCSVGCHMIWNHSRKLARLGNQLDYLGIILLMWTASLPSIYYGFYCDEGLRNVYLVLTSALAVACCVATLNPRFATPRFRSYRAALYVSLGFTALNFVVHGVLLYGDKRQMQSMSLDWMLLMATLNVVGAGFYACRVPERWWPYRFDYVGASHQIFHVMVVLAGIAHYRGLVRAFLVIRGASDWCAFKP